MFEEIGYFQLSFTLRLIFLNICPFCLDICIVLSSFEKFNTTFHNKNWIFKYHSILTVKSSHICTIFFHKQSQPPQKITIKQRKTKSKFRHHKLSFLFVRFSIKTQVFIHKKIFNCNNIGVNPLSLIESNRISERKLILPWRLRKGEVNETIDFMQMPGASFYDFKKI